MNLISRSIHSLSILIFCLAACPSFLFGQAFEALYTHAENDSVVIADIAAAENGGLWVLATVDRTATTNDINASDGLVLRLNAQGELLWSKEYDAGTFQSLNGIQGTPDGGFIIGGTTTTEYFDGYLAKADANGEIEWARFVGDEELQRIYDINTTSDGGYLLVGHYLNFFRTNLFVAKLGPNGEELWSKVYTLPNDEEQTAYSVQQLPDGSFLICGSNGELFNEDALVVKLSDTGSLLWANTYDYQGFANSGAAIAPLPSGEIILLQATQLSDDPLSGATGLIVSRLDEGGDERWSRLLPIDEALTTITFNGLNYAFSASPGGLQVDGADIVLYTRADTDNSDDLRPNLLKLNQDGDLIWGREFSEPGFLHFPTGGDFGDNLTLTTDNHYAILYQGVEERQSLRVAKIDAAAQNLCVSPVTPAFTDISLAVAPRAFNETDEAGQTAVTTNVRNRTFTASPIANASIEIDLGPDTILCANATLTLDSDLGPGFTYLWQDGSTAPTLAVTEEGAYSVTVAQDECSATDTILVATLSSVLALGPDATLCDGESLTLAPAITYNGDYNWNTGATGSNLTVDQPGTYILVFTNACGTVADTVDVNAPAPFAFSISGAEPACANTAVTLSAAGGPGLTYEWQDENGNNLSDSAAYSFTLDAAATLLLLATDGCTIATEVANLSPLPTPAVEATLQEPGCGTSDGNISLEVEQGQPPFSFEWEDGSGNLLAQEGGSIGNLSGGSYFVTITDAAGCTAGFSWELPILAPLSFELEISNPDCLAPDGGSIALNNVTGGASPYRFSLDGAPVQEQGLFVNLSGGAYNVLLADANGCDTAFTLALAEPQPFGLSITTCTPALSLGDSALLNIQSNRLLDGDETFEWSTTDGLSCTDCPSPFAAPLRTTEYLLTLTDSDGCQATASLRIEVDSNSKIYIPNAFSPNEDGRNDRFLLYPGKGVQSVDRVQIFNRWGGLVYEAAGNAGWDGNTNGSQAGPGLYVYQVVITLVDGRQETLSGEVALVR